MMLMILRGMCESKEGQSDGGGFGGVVNRMICLKREYR